MGMRNPSGRETANEVSNLPRSREVTANENPCREVVQEESRLSHTHVSFHDCLGEGAHFAATTFIHRMWAKKRNCNTSFELEPISMP